MFMGVWRTPEDHLFKMDGLQGLLCAIGGLGHRRPESLLLVLEDRNVVYIFKMP